MKPINDHANRALRSRQKQQPNEDCDASRQKERLLWLWERMTVLYGWKWTTQNGIPTDEQGRLSRTARTWLNSIQSLTESQIKQALNAILQDNNEWPPSLKDFLIAARIGRTNDPNYCKWYGQDPNDPVIKKLHANRPSLPAPEGTVIKTPAEFTAHARKLLRCGTQVEGGPAPGGKTAFVSNPDRRKQIAAELAKHGAKVSP